MARRERNNLSAPAYEKRIGTEQECANILLDQGRESRLELTVVPHTDDPGYGRSVLHIG